MAAPARAERRPADRQRSPAARATPAQAAAPRRPGSWVPLGCGLLVAGLWWASLPPLGAWPLAWLAPAPLVWLARGRTLPGRRPYWAVGLAGLAFWLATLHWLRLPHPATSIGWVALSLYLAGYWPAWLALTRFAVHRAGAPLALAAPVTWVALEFVQAHLLSGFAMASLAHSQAPWTAIIQLADLGGQYLVSGLIVAVAATLVAGWPEGRRTPGRGSLVAAAVLVGLAWGYGLWRLAAPLGPPLPPIALIQGSIDTELKSDPGEADRIFLEYFSLSQQALREQPQTALVVWPETMFRWPLITATDDVRPADGFEWTREQLDAAASEYRRRIGQLAERLGQPLVLGIDVHHYGPGTVERYNSALLVTAEGEIAARYDKMHPVMFGEYVPLAKWFPWLYGLTPLGGGIEAGERPSAFVWGGGRLAPNICYESILPHLIRGQVATLRAAGEEPDVLVNLTNDGWFWGSSELDLHLICGQFRAVECRKPLVIAANTGLSAAIDSCGRVLAQGPRRATQVVPATVSRDPRRSPYSIWGDWPSLACLGLVGLWCVAGRMRHPPFPEPTAAS